jgi:hypothetical protein
MARIAALSLTEFALAGDIRQNVQHANCNRGFTTQISATISKSYPEVTDSTFHFGTDGTLLANAKGNVRRNTEISLRRREKSDVD